MSQTLSVTKFSDSDLSGDWSKDRTKIQSSLNTMILQLNSGLDGGLRLSQNLGVQVLNFNVNVPTPWIQVTTFTNSWVNFNTSVPARYMKDSNGAVWLDGAIKSGTIGATAFALPQPLWPGQDCTFATDCGGTHGRLVVSAAGAVKPDAGSNTIFSLGVSFQAATFAPANPLCFPLYFKSNVGNASIVLPGSIQDVTSGSGSALKLSNSSITWANDNGQIRIDNVAGLLPNRQYNITAYAFPG